MNEWATVLYPNSRSNLVEMKKTRLLARLVEHVEDRLGVSAGLLDNVTDVELRRLGQHDVLTLLDLPDDLGKQVVSAY